MKIIYTAKFSREYKKLPSRLKHLAEEREIIFRDNHFDSRLKTHKLKGKFKDFLAFSIDYRYRIIFEISKDSKTSYFYSVSNHDVYR